jgi:hypothetical protein
MILTLAFVALGALTPEARLTAIQGFLHVDKARDLQEMWHGSGNSIWAVSVEPCCHDHIVAFSADTPTSELAIVDGEAGLQEITVVGSNKGPTVLLQTYAVEGDHAEYVLATLWMPTMTLREVMRYYGVAAVAKRNDDRVNVALALDDSGPAAQIKITAPLGKWCAAETLERFAQKAKPPRPEGLKMMITLGAGGNATITTCK